MNSSYEIKPAASGGEGPLAKSQVQRCFAACLKLYCGVSNETRWRLVVFIQTCTFDALLQEPKLFFFLLNYCIL
eukprot:11925777-Ditylum_brightwellii.AAC.1